MICFITSEKKNIFLWKTMKEPLISPWSSYDSYEDIFKAPFLPWFFSPGGVNQGGDLQCEGIATATEIGTDLSTVLGYPG